MSSLQGFGQQFGIHINNDEKQCDIVARKTKREDSPGKSPARKRAALVSLTSTIRCRPGSDVKPPKQVFYSISLSYGNECMVLDHLMPPVKTLDAVINFFTAKCGQTHI